MAPDKSGPARRRKVLRDALWPGSEGWIWHRSSNQGFTTIPRLLPLVLHLIRRLARKGDPSTVYMDLWARTYDEGIVSIDDEEECAYGSGYTGTRAVRTWREHMLNLVELGFILARRDGNREYGQVLILNPLGVSARLHAEGKLPEGWWTAFVRRASEIGAVIPPPLILADAVRPTLSQPTQNLVGSAD